MEPDAVANFVRGALQSGDFGTLVDQLEEAELHVRDLRFPSRPRRPTTAPRGEFRAQCIFIPDEPADALHAPADAPGSAPFALAQAAERSAVLSSDFCAALLMAHTLNGEAVDAKHCWKRIPREVKDRSHELRAVWTIGQHLLQEDTATADLGHVFLAMRVYEWSPLVAEMVAALAERLRQRNLTILAHGYAKIPVTTLAPAIGLTPAEALPYCTERGWTADAAANILTPPAHRAAGAGDAPLTEAHIRDMSRFAAFAETGALIT